MLPFILSILQAEGSEVFRVRKSNHSKKIVKQLKREYKEDLEKSGHVKQEIKTGLKTAHTSICRHAAFKQRICIKVCLRA